LSHAGHSHAAPAARALRLRASFLRSSALGRLAGIGVLLALLWAAVLWALQ
jgi:hypothetical protein